MSASAMMSASGFLSTPTMRLREAVVDGFLKHHDANLDAEDLRTLGALFWGVLARRVADVTEVEDGSRPTQITVDVGNIGTMIHTVARTCGTIGRADLADLLNCRGPAGSIGSMLARTAAESAGRIPELAHLFAPAGSFCDAQEAMSSFSRKMMTFQAAAARSAHLYP